MAKKKLPKFKSEKEEALFWETHSPLDYTDEFEELDESFEIDPKLEKKIIAEREKKRSVTFRIEPSKVAIVKVIADKLGIGYQSLFRMWISENIYKELNIHPEIIGKIKKLKK